MLRTLAVSLLLAAPAHADGAQDFVTANVISTLYHEFGHALIDLTDASVLGREEDAADILSVILLDEFWEEDAAESITALTALSFELAAQEAEEPAYWDVHGLDMQRYYNQVCLFYGADPDTRAALAEEFALPAERAETCVEEYDLAAASWAAVLDPLTASEPTKSIGFDGETSSDIGALIASEVTDLNQAFTLPKPVTVALTSCGEENAFYDPETATITICTEYVEFLERQAIANDL
ncbi:DUF4344 domain-containing metallopeptidase [Pseudorhodobacter ferrugineus]|uniref:DUF4344 domain-containing metallopeptidase n=1 Tax=Pseudorhodobacter ferrugineus TaxID=77008 RepID=UPI0003B590A8|nr:DUF4344 domain-containing metallopeptidase [Pseudorhodobacter ferrugineus]